MKNLLLTILAAAALAGQSRAAYTEFYCQTTATNMNGGSDTADAATVTATNGNWTSGTGVFICAGATDLSALTVGQFASVYNDGATAPVFIARVTAVDDGTDTITTSTLRKSGTAPTTSATARTIKVGGAWKGPNGTDGFPITLATAALTNVSDHPTRINFKTGTDYTRTTGTIITAIAAGPMTYQGYTTTAGDGGRAKLVAGAGVAYHMLTIGGSFRQWTDFEFDCTAHSSGSGACVHAIATNQTFLRCVFRGARGAGVTGGNQGFLLIECEAYGNNVANGVTSGGFAFTSGGSNCFIRCISHDNTGSNSDGFYTVAEATFINCIADTNGRHGFVVNSVLAQATGCDAYNNTGSGFNLIHTNPANTWIANSNFIKNGAYGIANVAPFTRVGGIYNCGFGSGTQANTSGDIQTSHLTTEGSVTYAANVTPWTDPANGDFRISLAAAKGTGRGAFLQTAASYAGAIGYPDIGAAEAVAGAASAGGTFAQ